MTTWTGRHPATWKDYPFVVFFEEHHPNGDKEPSQFTGTLIHDCFILTAAHNVFDENREQDVDVKNLKVVFSDQKVRDGAVTIYPAFHCCPNYVAEARMKPIAFDAALMKLVKTVDVPTIDPSLDDDSEFRDKKTRAEVVGWDLSGPDRLWMCPTRFSRFSQKKIHECGKFQTTASTEDGDSGGPLVVKKDGNWFQIGIHSGRRQQQLTRWSSSKYSYSTRVAHPTISNWIKKEISPRNEGLSMPMQRVLEG